MPASPHRPPLRWPPLVVVGLTGGIAAGKSTVARAMAAAGATVLHADELGREVVAPGEPALAELAAHFGPEVLLPSGELDRAAVGRRVFGDPRALALLNRITHPRIEARLTARLRALQRRPPACPVVVLEAAILIEAGWHRQVDRVVVVTVQPSTQVRRLTAGSGLPGQPHERLLTEEEARARIASQLDDAARLRHADYEVCGESPITEMSAEAAAITAELRRLTHRPASP